MAGRGPRVVRRSGACERGRRTIGVSDQELQSEMGTGIEGGIPGAAGSLP